MGTVTAIEQCEQIRRELRELELKNSPCPVDRRRAEKEAEARAQEAQTAQEQKNTANWAAWVDHRIMQYLDYYCLHLFEHDDKDKPTIMNAAIGGMFGSERMDRRAEVKAAIEEERQSVDAKLAALEQASNDRWAVIDQRILQHIERAREHVLQSTKEVLGQFRAELKEFKPTLEEKERLFDAKLAALEERLKSVPGKLPVVKSSWQPESVTYQAEMVCHNGALYQARKDTAQAPGGSDWICIARHGRDAVTPTVRGAYGVNDSYAALDIVSFDGCAYIARSDAPGLCPGDGWEPLSKRGQRGRKGEAIRGPQGEKGAKGDNGDDALEIIDNDMRQRDASLDSETQNPSELPWR